MRRFFLSSVAVGLCLCVLRPSASASQSAKKEANGHTELSVSTYEGQSNGFIACGGQSRVRYGGVAGQVTHSARSTRHQNDAGLVFKGALAMELDAEKTSASDAEAPDSKSKTYFSTVARLSLGYEGRYAGFNGHLMGTFGYVRHLGTGAIGAPSADLRLGSRKQAYLIGGWGAPPTLSALGLWGPNAGFGWAMGRHASAELRLGRYVISDSWRGDLNWRVQFRPNAHLSAGLAVGQGRAPLPPDREANVGLIWGF